MSSLLKSCKKYFGSKNLYEVLKITKDDNEKKIRTAYYKLSLQVHPDKVKDEMKAEATEQFQILGKIYSILSNKEKKAIYDETGVVDEEDDNDEPVNWAEFWRKLFKPITKEDIDAYEKTYKGSDVERNDLKKAYLDGKGDMDIIYECVPYTTVSEEPRYRALLQEMIDDETIPEYEGFTHETPRKRERRKRKYKKEEKEATHISKQQKEATSDLAMIILKRQEERNGSFLDKLEAKYSSGKKAGSSGSKKKGKK